MEQVSRRYQWRITSLNNGLTSQLWYLGKIGVVLCKHDRVYDMLAFIPLPFRIFLLVQHYEGVAFSF